MKTLLAKVAGTLRLMAMPPSPPLPSPTHNTIVHAYFAPVAQLDRATVS